jgi:hypothetical protein
MKLKAGHGGFLCQCATAFPANMIVFVPPPESYFVTVLPSGSAIRRPHAAAMFPVLLALYSARRGHGHGQPPAPACTHP